MSKVNNFKRSGIASLDDLSSLEWQELYRDLSKFQQKFLTFNPHHEFYKWPKDSLHTCTRIWEYPYVYYHLKLWRRSLPKAELPTVVDLGSGVTFFTFAVALMLCNVIPIDLDPCNISSIHAVMEKWHSCDSKIFPIQGDVRNIPLLPNSVDCVYCISVLEHIPDFEKTVTEMARILKPGGLCLITCDINLQPEDGRRLDGVQYKRLISLIDKAFTRIWPERTIHPVDVLTTMNSPYPLAGSTPGVVRMAFRLIKQKILKPLLGRKPGFVRTAPPHVAVLGLVLRKGI